MKARRLVYGPPARAGSRNTPWPVPSYLPRPGAASSALSTLRDIVIPLAHQFVDGIIRYVFPTAGSRRARIEGAALGHFRRAYRDPPYPPFPGGTPGCNHPCLLAYLSL